MTVTAPGGAIATTRGSGLLSLRSDTHSGVVDKAVANPGESLYKFGMFGGVFERLPQFFHCGVNRMLKVHECVLRPEGSAQLLAGDNSSFRLQKQPQQLEWLVLNWHTHARTEQLTAPQIYTERVKAYRRPPERTVRSQLAPLLSEGVYLNFVETVPF